MNAIHLKSFSLFLAFLFVLGISCLPFAREKAEIKPMWGSPMVYDTEDMANREVTFRDMRLLHMDETKTPFRMPVYPTEEAWQQRAKELKIEILVAAGLWPHPPRTALHAHIFGKIQHPGYSVEKVYFESYPGFFVTGNLYRPVGKTPPFPAVLTPHGHWKHGRLENSERASVPGRCINLARQGYVVFSYDMVGYVDSKQVTHHFARDSLSQAYGINLLELQLWDSFRSLDFLESLPDVDTTRIGCTGASGGGTQTFLLTAVDPPPRVRVTAPVNMVSAHFQGGCLCENSPGLRLGTFNVEFAAMAAPRPLLLVANTHDWTKNTLWEEFPAIRKIYRLFGAEDHLKYVQFDFPHNYNKASREAVYAWFGRWILRKSHTTGLKERSFTMEPRKNLLVFPDKNPPGDLTEAKLKLHLRRMACNLLEANWPKNAAELARFRKLYGTAYQTVLAAGKPEKVEMHTAGVEKIGDFSMQKLLISRKDQFDWVPALFLKPGQSPSRVVLVVSGRGKAVLFQPHSGRLKSWAATLLKQGCALLAIDIFKVDEQVLPPGTETARNEKFKFFTTFNRTTTQEQVQDVLTALAFARTQSKGSSLDVLGLDSGGAVALLTAGLSQGLGKILIDARFLATERDSLLLKYFVPGLGRIGDFQTAASLSSCRNLQLFCPTKSDWFDEKKIAEVYQIGHHTKKFGLIHRKLTTRTIVESLGSGN